MSNRQQSEETIKGKNLELNLRCVRHMVVDTSNKNNNSAFRDITPSNEGLPVEKGETESPDKKQTNNRKYRRGESRSQLHGKNTKKKTRKILLHVASG
jgi:hypothetical protein